MCLNSFDGSTAPKDIEFLKEYLWIQLHNIPFGGVNKAVGLQIGGLIGEVLEMDLDKEGIGWGPYLRVKVAINILKPLMRGIHLSMGGTRTWISFQYERLPFFCFNVVGLGMVAMTMM